MFPLTLFVSKIDIKRQYTFSSTPDINYFDKQWRHAKSMWAEEKKSSNVSEDAPDGS